MHVKKNPGLGSSYISKTKVAALIEENNHNNIIMRTVTVLVVCLLLALACGDSGDYKLGSTIEYRQRRNYEESTFDGPLNSQNNQSDSSRGSGSAITSSNPVVSVYYVGGSTSPYMGGLTSPTGLKPKIVNLAKVQSHFPGYWGPQQTVYGYDYQTVLNNTQFEVDCYCIRSRPCSCDQVNTTDLFSYLEENTGAINFERFSNHSHVYLNGTLTPLDPRKANSASSTHLTLLLPITLFITAFSF